jgi:hypothetical protein
LGDGCSLLKLVGKYMGKLIRKYMDKRVGKCKKSMAIAEAFCLR